MKLNALMEMAKRATPDQFYGFAKEKYGADKVKSLSWPEIMAIAADKDVQIPAYLRTQKVGRGRFNLVPPEHADNKPAPKKEEPKAQSEGVDVADIKKLVPELGREISGDMLDWNVREYKGKVYADWNFTFRRDTRQGAYERNKHRIEDANARIESIAKKYPNAVIDKHVVSPASVKKSDQQSEDNGDGAYSEYEQSLGGGITLKAK